MRDLNEAAELIAHELGLDQAEIDKRKSYLELNEVDAALLRQVHKLLQEDKENFSSVFYQHLLGFPELRGFLSDAGTLARLHASQSAYFNSLTAGDYGDAYVRDRLKVGIVHQRIGLEPKWYIGAYRKYLTELLARLWQLLHDKPDMFIAAYGAVLKVVCLDMGLALDTYAQAAQQELQESEELFRLTFNQAAVGIAHTDPAGPFLRINRKLCDITGYTEAELLQRTYQQITHPDDVAEDTALVKRLSCGEISEYSREKRYIHKNGRPVWVHATVSSMRDAAGRMRCIALIEDISRRKEAEEELLRMANHDSLTGLPNRLLLQDRLSQAIAHAHRVGRMVGVMFIDLDRFKNVNDSLGHDAGDEVIIESARRISGSLREADTVARQGGDEFVVVLPDMAHAEDAQIVAQKILDALFQPMTVEGQEVFPTGSIGISLYPHDGDDSQTLLKNADVAMYRAKAQGRNGFHFYDGGMGERALDSLRLEGALRRALERNEFLLHYQPQIDICTGEVVGVEALLRWQPQGREMISPADFIPIAEETGLIVPIGEWVLATACAQHTAWREAGLPAIRIGVNLSARQFQRQDLAKRVAQILEEEHCDPAFLALEITESDVMQDPQAAVEILRQLHEMGVHLSIDDFGTGYSSLSYLKRFPIDSLKIDRSFVRDITTDADDAMIVNSVIALAHSMKLSVIAEGVENAMQLDFLSENGCDQMQGYFFSQPVPAARIAELLQAANPSKLHAAPT